MAGARVIGALLLARTGVPPAEDCMKLANGAPKPPTSRGCAVRRALKSGMAPVAPVATTPVRFTLGIY